MFRGFRSWFSQMMYGRYGSDRLNVVLMIAAGSLLLTASVLASIARVAAGNTALSAVSFGVQLAAMLTFALALFRTLSRNHATRQKENRAFMNFWRKLTDRNNCYYACPKCGQTVRVPRGRGEIRIKCPRCGERFVKKT